MVIKAPGRRNLALRTLPLRVITRLKERVEGECCRRTFKAVAEEEEEEEGGRGREGGERGQGKVKEASPLLQQRRLQNTNIPQCPPRGQTCSCAVRPLTPVTNLPRQLCHEAKQPIPIHRLLGPD